MNGLKPNKINYITRLKDKDPSAQNLSSKKFVLPLIIVLAAVIAVEGYFLVTIGFIIKPNLAAIQAFTENPASISEYAEVKALDEQLRTLTDIRDNYQFAFTNINSYPEFTLTAYNAVVTASQKYKVALTYVEYERETGLLTIEGTTTAVLNCSSFVKALRETKVFGPLYYYGYSGANSNTKAGAGATTAGNTGGLLTTLTAAYTPSVTAANQILTSQQTVGSTPDAYGFNVICTLYPQEVGASE